MNNLENITTMSSREISLLTGKEHRSVLRDCDNLNENYAKLGLAQICAGVYLHPNTGTQQHREYLLTKMQCFDLMTGYSIELRIKVNRRWEELEQQDSPELIMARALQVAKETLDRHKLQLEQANTVIKEQAPKVQYYDDVLSSKGLMTINTIANDLGMSAIKLNKILVEKKVQYREHNTYVLYAKYRNMDLVKHVPYTYLDRNGESKTAQHMYWTEKGRQFIYGIVNESFGQICISQNANVSKIN